MRILCSFLSSLMKDPTVLATSTSMSTELVIEELSGDTGVYDLCLI